ncbi:hypothetical protein SynPROSU1_02281 [Synechococcus sp. PROS-U-1]|nr:hypothetical protein SynPROSU1_02281 [Synechococcus sp. PROS-U-1]
MAVLFMSVIHVLKHDNCTCSSHTPSMVASLSSSQATN